MPRTVEDLWDRIDAEATAHGDGNPTHRHLNANLTVYSPYTNISRNGYGSARYNLPLVFDAETWQPWNRPRHVRQMSPEFEALLQGWETDIDAVLAMEDHSAHPAYVVAEKMLALADQWEFDRLMQGLGLRPFDAEVLAAHQGSPIQATCRYTQKFISDGEIILTDAWGLMLRERGDEGFCAPYLCLKGKDDEWRDLSAWLFHVEE